MKFSGQLGRFEASAACCDRGWAKGRRKNAKKKYFFSPFWKDGIALDQHFGQKARHKRATLGSRLTTVLTSAKNSKKIFFFAVFQDVGKAESHKAGLYTEMARHKRAKLGSWTNSLVKMREKPKKIIFLPVFETPFWVKWLCIGL